MSRRLLDDGALAASSVVVNCAMNRERQLAGVNSYSRELGFNPLDWLRSRMIGHDRDGTTTDVGWLDLCCGTGRALIQAADELKDDGLADRVGLVGVDLVDSFGRPSPHGGVELISASMAVWRPPRRFDLITCVHGLHYVGDKLAVITRAAGALADDGLFIADVVSMASAGPMIVQSGGP